METLIKADIFFFVTTIAVVILVIVITVVLVYVASILKDIKYISRNVKTQSDLIISDVDDFRRELKAQGAGVSSIFGFFKKFLAKSRSQKKNNS